MSTTSAVVEPIQTGITNNWTRCRPSFLRGLAQTLEYAEFKCFGLILDSTVGANGKPWAKITPARFCDVAGISRRRYEQAIAALLGGEEDKERTAEDRKVDKTAPEVFTDSLVRRRKAAVGSGYEYSIVARPTLESSGIAKCRGCGQTSEIELDVEFIPVPHSFFVSLPSFCDHGMYLIVKTVVERTMRWDKATKQIVVMPCEITIEEFERATGRKRSEIFQDLDNVQVEGASFIGSQKSGRNRLYWAIPENFASGVQRVKREVKQPKERKKRETKNPTNPIQPVEPKQPIRPVEFVTSPCGVCRNCGCYGPVDLVEPEQKAPKKPIERARAGPKDKIWGDHPVFNSDIWKKDAVGG